MYSWQHFQNFTVTLNIVSVNVCLLSYLSHRNKLLTVGTRERDIRIDTSSIISAYGIVTI